MAEGFVAKMAENSMWDFANHLDFFLWAEIFLLFYFCGRLLRLSALWRLILQMNSEEEND